MGRSYELTHLRVGATELAKEDLPKIMPEFVDSTIQYATQRKKQFDIIASHYWLSGVVGCALAAEWANSSRNQFSHHRKSQKADETRGR